jgi:hypothetical protein
MSKGKYKRVTDLYVEGVELPLEDGSVIWMQVLNPFERDEAVHDAQVARSRFVLAMKEDGAERIKVEAKLAESGRDAFIKDLANLRSEEKLTEVISAIQDDPDWKERLDVIQRTDPDNNANPLNQEELLFLAKVQGEYIQEIYARQEIENTYLVRHYEAMNERDLLEEYLETWLQRRGGALAQGEYLLTEMWYGARCCNAMVAEEGYDHRTCDHSERVFDSKSEVRGLPEGLQILMRDALNSVSMSVRDAKNSDRQGSSSDSSPLPSEAAESTPSTPSEIPVGAHGS